MQFKHSEILYFLGLLIIPIIVHLFQLQRFVKTPFTNVHLLQKLVLQTRKSSRIKKWLILCTRLSLITFLVLAFAQPYFSNRRVSDTTTSFIYLDNSLSTNTKGEKGDLLQIASQEIIENISEKTTYSLLTNDQFYKNKTAAELKDILLKVKNTAIKFNLNDVILKVKKETQQNEKNKNILISDFQNVNSNELKQLSKNTSLVQLLPQQKENLAIDSVFISNNNANNFNINVIIKNQGIAKKNIPLAIYNNDKLINKQLFSIEKNNTTKVVFPISNRNNFLGKIQLTFNDSYHFDNSFYFSTNTSSKNNVLNITNTNNFLYKIYTNDEFNLTTASLQNLNYNDIAKQDLIVLNEIENYTESFINNLLDYTKKGGDVVIIPHQKLNINSYNSLLNKLKLGNIISKRNDSLKITSINFNHPLIKNAFEKTVENFQYPFVKTSYVSSFKNTTAILSLENKLPFIQQFTNNNSSIYWVTAPLNKENSNFTNSPLIVPIFYNIGKQSLTHSKLYYTLAEENNIAVNKQLSKNEILTIANTQTSFIPLQQTLQNSVKITTGNKPLKAGIYQIKQQENVLKNIAFNYPKNESLLRFADLSKIKNTQISSSVKSTFININDENKIQWLWKWFLALAIVSLLIEIFILKFFKP